MSFRYRAHTPVADAIRHIDSDKCNRQIYTLDGRRVSSMQRKGLYIVDGKKIVP